MKNIIKLTNLQQQILIGSLLGDGCLYLGPKSKNACLSITRTSRDKNYLLWEASVFNEFLTPKSLTDMSIFDKRTNKTYRSSRLRTCAHQIFTEYYQIWYPDGTKKVPKNIDLTPLVLAVWFADDGSIHLGRGHKNTNTQGRLYPERLNIKLSTHGFAEGDILFLRDLLENFTQIKWSKYTDKSGTFLFLGRSGDAKKILQLIDPVFPMGMDRKSNLWRRPEADLFGIKKIKPQCKWCKSNKVFKNGKNNQKRQKYLCKDCRRQYV